MGKMNTAVVAMAIMVLSFGVMMAYSDDGPCCYAMNAKCLACSAGKTIEAYCAENQDATGCEARVDGSCCYAMTAVCLACNQGESVAEYCGANPSTVGCPPYVIFSYQYYDLLHN